MSGRHATSTLAFDLFRRPRENAASRTELGGSRYGVTRIGTIDGENGMVLQPVHELVPRGRVRGGSR